MLVSLGLITKTFGKNKDYKSNIKLGSQKKRKCSPVLRIAQGQMTEIHDHGEFKNCRSELIYLRLLLVPWKAIHCSSLA